MTGSLHGKVALITGAGAGIGAGLARRFAHEGARVVVAEYDALAGAAVANEVGGLFVETDVAQRDQVEDAVAAALAEYGALDILVNNAWGGERSTAWRPKPTSRWPTAWRWATTDRSGRCAPHTPP